MAVRLANKVAVITGAAAGIGRAAALRFVSHGARVVAGDIDEAGLCALAEQAPDSIEPLVGDVTTAAANEALVARALHRFGACDVFYANAGGSGGATLHTMDETAYRADLALNLDAAWHGIQAALPVMRTQRRGVILATASSAGLGAVPGLSAYGAAKAGLLALIRSVALEYGHEGIRANAISPGPIEGPGLLDWLAALPGGRRAYEARLPLRRLGRPEDIAAVAAFLASDEAAYVSGACVPVDGAISSSLFQPAAPGAGDDPA